MHSIVVAASPNQDGRRVHSYQMVRIIPGSLVVVSALLLSCGASSSSGTNTAVPPAPPVDETQGVKKLTLSVFGMT